MTARIGRALTAALAEAGMTRGSLARELGMSADGVGKAAAGTRVPALETAERMAELLGAPAILKAVIEARTRVYPVCDVSFVDRGRNCRGRTCSATCQTTHYQRRARAINSASTSARLRVTTNRLRLHQRLTLAHCMSCTGRSLVCRDASCEWRPVSPAKLAAEVSGRTPRKVA